MTKAVSCDDCPMFNDTDSGVECKSGFDIRLLKKDGGKNIYGSWDCKLINIRYADGEYKPKTIEI